MSLALTHTPDQAITREKPSLDAKFATYAHLEPAISRERVLQAFEAEVAYLDEHAGVHAVSYAEGETSGRAFWRKAEWETGHLGSWSARLDHLLCPSSASPSLRPALLARLKDEWRARDIRYIFSRIDAANHPTLHALEQAGFITVDNISMLLRDGLKQGSSTLAAPVLPVSPATEEDVFHLARMAREAFREDRFHNDPLIPNTTAEAMHGDWIRNQVVNGLADEVLVAKVDGTPVGFVSMVIDRASRDYLGASIGTIVLLAVDASVRGQGLGKTMTRAALEWFRRHDVRFVQVGTQAWNVPALRSYLAAGFKPARSFTTLRLHMA